MTALSVWKPSSKFSPSCRYKRRINSVNVEWNMKRTLTLRIQILNWLSHNFSNPVLINVIHCKAFNFLFFQRGPLVDIYVSDSNENEIVHRQSIFEPLKIAEITQTCQVCKWNPVIPVIITLFYIDEVWMGIHPDDLKVGVLSEKSWDTPCSYWMVPPNS